MTPIRIHAPLLRTLHVLTRAVFVGFLAIPGAGFALFAVACGDLDVPRESMPHDAVVADIIVAPVAPRPIVPHVTLVTPPPTSPTMAEVPVEPPVTVVPSLLVEEEPEDGGGFYEPGCEGPAPELKVVEATTAHGVARRKPLRPGQAFEVGDVAWAWIAVQNTGDKAPIRMVWRRDGVVRSRMALDVGTSHRWRTWSRKTLRSGDVGTWTVDVLGPEDTTLHTLTFEVAPAPVEVTSSLDEFDGC